MEKKDDVRFVVKSWVRDFAHPRNPWSGPWPRDVIIKETRAQIYDLLKDKANVYCVMACPEDDRDQIYGFACFEEGEDFPILHYVYVKRPFRGHKIGSSLISIAKARGEGTLRYTYRTPICNKFLSGAKHNWNLTRKRKEKKNGVRANTEAELPTSP
jgi:GNAT superfamily N-acetyltransferase